MQDALIALGRQRRLCDRTWGIPVAPTLAAQVVFNTMASSRRPQQCALSYLLVALMDVESSGSEIARLTIVDEKKGPENKHWVQQTSGIWAPEAAMMYDMSATEVTEDEVPQREPAEEPEEEDGSLDESPKTTSREEKGWLTRCADTGIETSGSNIKFERVGTDTEEDANHRAETETKSEQALSVPAASSSRRLTRTPKSRQTKGEQAALEAERTAAVEQTAAQKDPTASKRQGEAES